MMKKIVSILAAAALICSTAMAEINLAGMSYDELIALQAQVTRQIMLTDKWQEVKVPAGVYQVGVEIPAGKWTIKPVNGQTAMVKVGTKLDESGKDFEYRAQLSYEQITSPTDSYSKYNQIDSVTFDLKDGQYIIIDSSPVIFTPYAGPSFSFK